MANAPEDEDEEERVRSGTLWNAFRSHGVPQCMPPEVMSQITYRGIPKTSEDWAALAKIASGQGELSRDELRRLFMLGLVQRDLGRVCLSEHGRVTLGLPGAMASELTGSDVAHRSR